MAKSVFQVLMEIEGDQKVKQAIGDIGKAAGLAGAALTAFSGAVAKTAADYEFSLAKVGTLATAATGSIAEFDQAVFQLSDRMDGAISANEAAAASYDVLSAGYSDQTDVLAILEESQKTAIGGYSDLATISDASTTVMNAFGDALGENLDVTQKVKLVTDGMIATQNLGKITAGEYSQQIGSVASTASAAGVSLEEVNAAVATATAQGVRVSSTFAGLNQVLVALMKPTGEAKVRAAELGIEFDAAALQSMGLSGVLQQLVDKGEATAENLTMLFGSVEAVKVLMPLVSNDAATFNKNLAAMGDTAGTVDKAFEMMSETATVKVQNSLKKLNNAFIQLGRGVLIAVSPVIDALDFLVTNFNKLPAPVQKAIGLLTVISGVTLTVAGGITLLATAVPAMIATFTAAIPVVTGFTLSMLGMQGLAWSGIVSHMGLLGLAATALAIKLAALALIVKGISLALEHYNNIEIEEKGRKFQEDLAATEPLVKMTERLVNEMRKTGEAIPDQKFNQYIKLLEDADGGTGLLTGHIKVLTDEQNKAKGSLDETNQALEETTLTTEEAAKQFEAYTKSVDDFLNVLNTQKETAILGLDTQGLGIEERLTKELELNQEYNAKILEQKEALAAQTQLSDSERLQAQSDINKLLAEEAKNLFETEEKLRDLTNQKTLDLFDTERAKAETLFVNKQVLSEDYYNYILDLLDKELAYKLSLIDKELEGAKAGSSEYQELQKERADLILQATNENLQINDKYNQELIEAEEQALERAEEQKEKLKELEKEAYEFKLTQIELELNAQKNANQEILENRKLANDQLSNQTQFLGGLEGIIGKISSNLEKDNLTLAQRNQLEEIGKTVLDQSAALGLQVNENLTVEQNLKLALNALELRKLDIQKQQLQLQQEIIKSESESAALDLSGNIEIAKQKLTDPSKTDQEKQQLQQEIDLNNKKLDLLNKQTEAKLKANEASQTLLDLEKSLAITTQSIAKNTPIVSTSKSSPTPTASEGETTKANLEKTATNTQESKTKLSSIDTNAKDIPMLSKKLGKLDNNDTILNATLNTINGSIINNGNILKTIKASIDGLPSKIASSLPRPSPTPSASSR